MFQYTLIPSSPPPVQEPMAMASIERTAYPRFQPIPHARELTEYFTPTAEDIAFGHTLVQRHAAIFPVILLLKCAQYLGYFPALSAIPSAIVNHVRLCLRLPAHLEPLTPPPRTLRRHERAIRTYLGLQPGHSHAARRLALYQHLCHQPQSSDVG
jgi:hypothetical protein